MMHETFVTEKDSFKADSVSPSRNGSSSSSLKRLVLGGIVAVAVVLAVVLAVVYGTENDDTTARAQSVGPSGLETPDLTVQTDPTDPTPEPTIPPPTEPVVAPTESPIQLPPGDGVRMQAFNVSTTISNRFATTRVNMIFANRGDCRAIHGFTMQLPKSARVKSLTMKALDCVFDSEVQTVKDARETFDEQASQGKPAALLEAWDMSDYYMQVSIHALGSTAVELVYEELLTRRSHEIPFQVPLSPGQSVDRFHVDVSITELEAGVSKFSLDELVATPDTFKDTFEITQSQTQASAVLDIDGLDSDVAAKLPRILRGRYDSSDIPENGLLIQSEECLLHLFNPVKEEENGVYKPLARNIVFVIDVSGSMRGEKLSDAKVAFANIIKTLSSNDYFAVHTFSDFGTESSGGPAMATEDAKAQAIDLVQRLSTKGGTNLNDAFVEAVEKVKVMGNQTSPDRVPILVVLTDGQATTGTTLSPSLARNVKAANKDVRAKIYGLAFGRGADLNLLKGISIQNEGRALEIFEGFFDSSDQIEDLYNGELGKIFMSDIDVRFQGAGSTFELLTQTKFPVLPGGSEVVVRAIMSKTSDNRLLRALSESESIRATTTARTSAGPLNWTVTSRLRDPDKYGSNECFQSFAHSRIAEILDFRDATLSLGSQMAEYAPFDLPDFFDGQSLARIAKEKAAEIAIESSIVWPGLTALVTLESEACAEILEDINVCRDGDGIGGGGRDDDGAGAGGARFPGAPPGAPPPPPARAPPAPPAFAAPRPPYAQSSFGAVAAVTSAPIAAPTTAPTNTTAQPTTAQPTTATPTTAAPTTAPPSTAPPTLPEPVLSTSALNGDSGTDSGSRRLGSVAASLVASLLAFLFTQL